jgi:hypothetical protein
MFPMAYIDTRTKKNVFTSYFLRSHFLFVMKILRTSRWDDCSYEKGSLRKDIPSIGTLVGLLLALTWQAASALLGLANLPLTSWRGLCQWSDWPPIGLARVHAYQGIVLRVFRVMDPTPPQVALRGPWKDFFAINDWRTAIHWLVLGGP